jgi:hypothetical protein
MIALSDIAVGTSWDMSVHGGTFGGSFLRNLLFFGIFSGIGYGSQRIGDVFSGGGSSSRWFNNRAPAGTRKAPQITVDTYRLHAQSIQDGIFAKYGVSDANSGLAMAKNPNQISFHDYDSEFPPVDGYPIIDPQRPPYSRLYTVVYSTELTQGIDFPGKSRPYHNSQANRFLYEAMLDDISFRQVLEENYPGIYKFVSPGPRGAFTRKTPKHLGLTWHHEYSRQGVGFNGKPWQWPSGIMQLIPIGQHESVGPVSFSLHPEQYGRGGYRQWG